MTIGKGFEPKESTAAKTQKIIRVEQGQPLPEGWSFVQWLGKETNLLGHWLDVVLVEAIPHV